MAWDYPQSIPHNIQVVRVRGPFIWLRLHYVRVVCELWDIGRSPGGMRGFDKIRPGEERFYPEKFLHNLTTWDMIPGPPSFQLPSYPPPHPSTGNHQRFLEDRMGTRPKLWENINVIVARGNSPICERLTAPI